MIRFIFGKIFLPVISLSAIAAGYYLLWVQAPDMQYEDVANRAMTGVILTLTGGMGTIIYIIKMGK